MAPLKSYLEKKHNNIMNFLGDRSYFVTIASVYKQFTVEVSIS